MIEYNKERVRKRKEYLKERIAQYDKVFNKMKNFEYMETDPLYIYLCRKEDLSLDDLMNKYPAQMKMYKYWWETLFWEEAVEQDSNNTSKEDPFDKREKRLKRKAELRYFFAPTEDYYEDRKAYDEYLEEIDEIERQIEYERFMEEEKADTENTIEFEKLMEELNNNKH